MAVAPDAFATFPRTPLPSAPAKDPITSTQIALNNLMIQVSVCHRLELCDVVAL